MSILTAIGLTTLCLTLASAQEFSVPVPLGNELMYSRMQSRLKGRVRTLLTVEKSDEGGFARTLSTITQSYDAQGSAVESSYHNAGIEVHSGNFVRLDYSSIYSYDRKGRLSLINEYDPDGSLRYKRVLSYDDNGRLTEWADYAGESKLLAKDGYFYDLAKRTTTVVRDRSKTVFFYNEKGWWIKRIVYLSDGLIEDNTTFEHDGYGNVIKETRYDKNDKYLYANLFTYKFDKFGNWIEKQATYTQLGDDGKPVSRSGMVVYRVITYFGGE